MTTAASGLHPALATSGSATRQIRSGEYDDKLPSRTDNTILGRLPYENFVEKLFFYVILLDAVSTSTVWINIICVDFDPVANTEWAEDPYSNKRIWTKRASSTEKFQTILNKLLKTDNCLPKSSLIRVFEDSSDIDYYFDIKINRFKMANLCSRQ